MNVAKRAILCMVHPSDCYSIIKREKGKFRFYVPIVFYLLIALVNYSYLFYVHFPLSIRDVTDANILLEAGIVIVPHFSWVVASYAMTAILDGESTFSEQLEAAVYALTPIIVFTPFLGLLSRILSASESGIYHTVYVAVYAATVLLLFSALMLLNDYSFGKAVAVAFLSVCAMVVMWAVVLLLMSLSIQLVTFVTNLFAEFKMKALL